MVLGALLLMLFVFVLFIDDSDGMTGIGETYGRGHSLSTIEKWMQKIV